MSWLKPELTGSPPSGGFHIGFDHRLRLVFAISFYKEKEVLPNGNMLPNGNIITLSPVVTLW